MSTTTVILAVLGYAVFVAFVLAMFGAARRSDEAAARQSREFAARMRRFRRAEPGTGDVELVEPAGRRAAEEVGRSRRR